MKQVIVDKFVNKDRKEVNVKRESRYIDSFGFMASSLDKLSNNLKIDEFVYLKKYHSCKQQSLLLRKGVYPYDYAHTVSKEFNIESMKDYHNLYNLCDVLLLADIF